MAATLIDLTTATAVAVIRQGDTMLKLSWRTAIALGGLKLLIGALVLAAARGARRAQAWEQGAEPSP